MGWHRRKKRSHAKHDEDHREERRDEREEVPTKYVPTKYVPTKYVPEKLNYYPSSHRDSFFFRNRVPIAIATTLAVGGTLLYLRNHK